MKTVLLGAAPPEKHGFEVFAATSENSFLGGAPLEKHGLEAVLLEVFGNGFLGGGPPEKHVLKLGSFL